MRARSSAEPAFVVETTAGDFPHARRGGVRLACCTCTTCCFTLLLGGIGALVGLGMGASKASRAIPQFENPVVTGLVAILWFIGMMLAWALLIAVVCGAVGFGIDMLVLR